MKEYDRIVYLRERIASLKYEKVMEAMMAYMKKCPRPANEAVEAVPAAVGDNLDVDDI